MIIQFDQCNEMDLIRPNSVIFLSLIMSSPTFTLKSQNFFSLTPNFVRTNDLDKPLRPRICLPSLRGGEDAEAPSENEQVSSARFQEFPLPVVNDNLAELLGKDTEEDDPSLDDVIQNWRTGQGPENSTDSLLISPRESNFSEVSESRPESSEVESGSDVSNITDVEKIKHNVGNRKSARFDIAAFSGSTWVTSLEGSASVLFVFDVAHRLHRPTFAEMDALTGVSKLPRSPDEEAEANK
jgi:hypothetical protein